VQYRDRLGYFAAAAWMFWPKAEDRGRPRFFADQTYAFQTLRALDDVSDIGEDTGETLQTVASLKYGMLRNGTKLDRQQTIAWSRW
jgi:hypothetical protein